MPPKKRASAISIGSASSRMKKSARTTAATKKAATSSDGNNDNAIMQRFLDLFTKSENYRINGISNSDLKKVFPSQEDYVICAGVINELTKSSRLRMTRSVMDGKTELYYHLLSASLAEQFSGLDASAKMVYQVIERAGDMGIWTKEVRIQTNIQQQALTKLFKTLEARQLIKPIKSIHAKSKKLYMLYNLTPSKQLTGGVWYTNDLEFDYEFIAELRTFLLQCARKINGGKGVTMAQFMEKMEEANVSRVKMSEQDITQLLQTLIYDFLLEPIEDDDGQMLFIATPRRGVISVPCEFQWWSDALAPDFMYRKIRFEDGVELAAHEPHYHT